MKKYRCTICGYIHEAESGELEIDFTCPLCAAPKELFEEVIEEGSKEEKTEVIDVVDFSDSDEYKELSNLEISAVCSNLAKGCEKQYLEKEALLFKKLADYFNKENEDTEFDRSILMNLINEDLSKNLLVAENMAEKHSDRGAKRALTWNRKVTLILKTLLEKYENDDLENTKVYVCTICGFIYVGDNLPAVCPVCKVPNYKFVEVEGN